MAYSTELDTRSCVISHSVQSIRLQPLPHICIMYSFIHSAFCLTTALQPLPKRVLPREQDSAPSFNLQYPLFSLRSSFSFLRLLPRLPVTSILPCIFPSVPCFRRQFIRKCDQFSQFSFLVLFVEFYSRVMLCVTSSFLTRSVQLISIRLHHHISKCYESYTTIVLLSLPLIVNFSTSGPRISPQYRARPFAVKSSL